MGFVSSVLASAFALEASPSGAMSVSPSRVALVTGWARDGVSDVRLGIAPDDVESSYAVLDMAGPLKSSLHAAVSSNPRPNTKP
jgi:hypothetical protein